MDEHLRALAATHLTTRFASLDVARAPFLVAKLNVRVLPCVIAFVDGVAAAAGRVVGFEGLGGGGDGFETAGLERRLVAAGVLEEGGAKGVGGLGGEGRGKGDGGGEGGGGEEEDDDDDEWD